MIITKNNLWVTVLCWLFLCGKACASIYDPECEIVGNFAGTGNHAAGFKLISESALGDDKAVEKTIDEGVDPNFSDPELMTPLAWASRCGHLDVVKALVRKGADVNLPVNYQRDMFYRFENSSALIWAATNKHVEIVCFLLEQGADRRRIERVYELNKETGDSKFVKAGRAAFDATESPEVAKVLRHGCN